MPSLNTSARMLILALVVTAGGMASCDRESPAQKDLNAASIALSTMSAGDKTPVDAEAARQAVIKKVKALADPYRSDAKPSVASLANLLSARAASMQGDSAAEKAAAGELQVMLAVESIRGSLNLYLQQSSVSAAAAKVDVTDDLKKLNETLTKARTDAAEFDRKHGEAMGDVHRVEAEVARLNEQSKAKRAEILALQATLSGKSAQESLAIVERCAVMGREADAIERRASETQVRANSHKATAADIARQKVAAERIAELTTQAIKATEAEAANMQAQAREAKSNADARAGEIAQALAALEGEYNGNYATQTKAATSAYEDSAKTATAAATGVSDAEAAGAKLATGHAQVSRAEVMVSKARTALAVSQTYSSLYSASPALPNASDLKTKAEAAAPAATAAIEEAREAFKAARDTFSGARGIDASVKPRIERLANELSKLAGEKPTVEPAAETVNKSSSATPSPASTGVEEVRAAIRAADEAMKKGDIDTALKSVHVAGDPSSVATVEEFLRGAARLEWAGKSKFKVGLKELLNGVPGLEMFAAGMSGTDSDADSYTITMKSDSEAEAVSPDGRKQTVRKVNGQWKMVLSLSDMGVSGPQATMMLGMFKSIGEVMSQLADDVESGKLADVAAVKAAAGQKMMELMQKLGPGMMPDPNK